MFSFGCGYWWFAGPFLLARCPTLQFSTEVSQYPIALISLSFCHAVIPFKVIKELSPFSFPFWVVLLVLL